MTRVLFNENVDLLIEEGMTIGQRLIDRSCPSEGNVFGLKCGEKFIVPGSEWSLVVHADIVHDETGGFRVTRRCYDRGWKP